MVFDETIFPFAHLHPNAGALLRKEILLLPSHLTGFQHGDDNCTDRMTNASNHENEDCDDAGSTQDAAEKNLRTNGEENSPNSLNFMWPLRANSAPGSSSGSG